MGFPELHNGGKLSATFPLNISLGTINCFGAISNNFIMFLFLFMSLKTRRLGSSNYPLSQ
jgi:hypothetical protein